jgi:hypothetical protein
VAVAWTEPDGNSAVQAFDVEAPWLALTAPLAIDRASRLNFTGDKLYAVSPSEGTVKVIDTLGWRVEQTFFPGADSRPIDIAVRGAVAYITRETATRLIVSSSCNTHNTEGGIEMIDLDTLQSLGIVAAENDLASGVCCEMAPFVMVSPSKGYFTFSTDSTLSSHLHFFTLDDGIDPADLYTSLDYEAANHVYDVFTDHLFVPALEQTPGFHVFDAANGTRLSSSIVPAPGNISDLVLLCGCDENESGVRAAITRAPVPRCGCSARAPIICWACGGSKPAAVMIRRTPWRSMSASVHRGRWTCA